MSYTSKQAARESQASEQQHVKPSTQLFSDQRTSTSVQLKQQQMMNTLQRMGTEEEEPVQGKFATAQLAEDEELLQGKFATAQRAAMEEEEPIQGKFETLQHASAEEEEPLQGKFNSTAPAQREQQPNNTGLPDNLKSGIENMSGYSMDDVKVHYNSDKPAQLNAHAYAQGTDIHVAPGQEQHLPHEAWHVVQQKQGRVQPTMQMKAGVPVNDDAGLENEADVMGAKALNSSMENVLQNTNVPSTQFFGFKKPLQFIRTRAESVAGDIMHSQRNAIFNSIDAAYTAIRTAGGSYAAKVDNITAAINNNRVVDYAQMDNNTLDDHNDILDMKDNHGGDEHMYVHNGGTIHISNRAGAEKKPHPALVGADPDVTCAGTLSIAKDSVRRVVDGWNIPVTRYRVTITTESGHFRPAAVPDGTVTAIKAVAEHAPTEEKAIEVKVV